MTSKKIEKPVVVSEIRSFFFFFFKDFSFIIFKYLEHFRASWVTQMVKNLPAKAGDAGSVPGCGRSPGNGNPLQYSQFGGRTRSKKPTDRGAWWATVHGVAQNWI